MMETETKRLTAAVGAKMAARAELKKKEKNSGF